MMKTLLSLLLLTTSLMGASEQWSKQNWKDFPGISDFKVDVSATDPDQPALGTVPQSISFKVGDRKFRVTASMTIPSRNIFEPVLEEWVVVREKLLWISTVVVLQNFTGGGVSVISIPEHRAAWDGTAAEKDRLVKQEENIQRSMFSRTNIVLFVAVNARVEER